MFVVQKQPKDTIIHMPPAPKSVKQKQQPKVGPRQTVWGAIWWSLATGFGMVYLAAVLCLCAWPIIHFIVKLGFHASLVWLPIIYHAQTGCIFIRMMCPGINDTASLQRASDLQYLHMNDGRDY